MAGGEWSEPERVAEYLAREIPHRGTAEDLLLTALPEWTERFLDLGTGDGRLLALAAGRFPGATGTGLDSSEPMLRRAAERFGDDRTIELRAHDMARPLTEPDTFDAVV